MFYRPKWRIFLFHLKEAEAAKKELNLKCSQVETELSNLHKQIKIKDEEFVVSSVIHPINIQV